MNGVKTPAEKGNVPHNTSIGEANKPRQKATASAKAKPRLTEEQRDAIREGNRRARRLVFASLGLFLTFYVLISLLITLFVYFSVKTSAGDTVLYGVQTVRYTGTKNTKKIITSSDADSSNKSYGLYISQTDLDALCGLSFAGDNEKITVIFTETDEYLECFANSSFIYINGNPTRLSSPVLYENGIYYFPVNMVDDYIIGINVVYDDESEICMLSLENGTDTILELKLKKLTSPQNIEQK